MLVPVNLSIADLARLISEIVGYEGQIEFDTEMPDGTPRKLMDSNRIHGLGWQATVELKDGLAATCMDFLKSNEMKDRE